MLTFLIMAGGSGERFWPLSTKENPKQLLKIFANKSLLRLTFERILPITDIKGIFVATNEIQYPLIKEELKELPIENIIVEPLFKDTAAAILYSSKMISKYYDNPTICVLASDHLISDENTFRDKIILANKIAQDGSIVTLGIKPSYPETGYGYIEIDNNDLGGYFKATCFKEKPDYNTALFYLESGNFLWNSGMFVFKSNVLFAAAKTFAKSHYDIVEDIYLNVDKNEGIKTAEDSKNKFMLFEKKSIDYAIMEKADNIMVIPSEFGWNDVGSYQAFYDLYNKNADGNIVISANLISIDSSNNVIIGSNKDLRVSILGIHDQIIVYTQKEILICAKDKIQEIKKILTKI